MRKEFLALSPKQMNRVTSNIQSACFFHHGNGDYAEMLRGFANRSAGGIKKIYMWLSELSEDEFEGFVDAMCS